MLFSHVVHKILMQFQCGSLHYIYSPVLCHFIEKFGKYDSSLVGRLISNDVACCMSVQHGQTALHLAASGGHLDVIQLLVEKGMNLDVRDKVRWCH